MTSKTGNRALKIWMMFALLFSLATLTSAENDPSSNLFSVVPQGDPTYAELKQLAQAGWISSKDLAPTLTRFDVVQLIEKAKQKSGELVVADDEIPPPPPDGNTPAASPAPAEPAAPAASTNPPQAAPAAAETPATSNDMELAPAPDVIGVNSAAEVNAPAAPTTVQEEAQRAEAIKNLHSLEDAYQYELKLVKDKVQALKDKTGDLENQQYDLRKRIMGVSSQYPKVAVYGLGRAFGLYQEYSGNLPPYASLPGTRLTSGYLDLNPVGTVSKEVSWNTIIRIGSDFEPVNPVSITLRRVTMDFNPPWFSAQVGDFDEAYTPLMLWNRDSLDLAYKPEMWARQDDIEKYESFLNDEPNWPLRGLRIGSDVMWPDSGFLQELSGSVFVHMIRNGFNDNGGWYIGPNIFTDLVFGGKAEAKSPKWYLGGMTVQAAVDGYGLIYDEPIGTEPPGSPYGAFNPSTWAHQYLLGSVKPDLKVGLGGDFYIGATLEYANSQYQDDKQNPGRIFNDFAMLGGPYLQFGNSRITFNYLNVGPYYYSPLAQTRQDAVTNLSNVSSLSYMNDSPELFAPILRNQYFLLSLPRAGGIYGFYDRTLDNTFPYGLATPNREGFGGELDVKMLEKNALKIKGSAYFVQEMGGNLVVNDTGNGFLPVDGVAGTTLLPIRQFVYVNAGPSFNLGPVIGWDRDLELGTNVRFEQTNSDLGTLTSNWLIGALRVQVLPVWEITTAYSWQGADGTEAGYNGTLWARYPYLYDNSDLGSYSPVTVNGSNQSLRMSHVFRVNRNSTIYLDYDYTWGNLMTLTPNQGSLASQFAEVTYEVKF